MGPKNLRLGVAVVGLAMACSSQPSAPKLCATGDDCFAKARDLAGTVDGSTEKTMYAFLESGCALNHPQSCGVLADFQAAGIGVAPNWDRAQVTAEKACSGGVDQSCKLVGELKFEGADPAKRKECIEAKLPVLERLGGFMKEQGTKGQAYLSSRLVGLTGAKVQVLECISGRAK